MKWFQGSITEAVTASKLKKAIFVVFIEGNDEVSKSFTDIINSEEISTILESEKFVAIKLESGSENHKFFAQIYQLVPVPSLFFINNGIPIEIISTVTTVADLVLKINSILDSINKDSGEKSSTQEFTKPTASTDPSVESQNNISDKNQSLSNEVTSSSSQEHSVPVEDKVKRAKELVELQKKKRQEEEDRKQKERELQRRQVGRDVQKMKQEQHELELKLAQEERLKEKNADAAARERILRQIEEDKLERKKKFEAYSKSLAQKKNEIPTKPKTATLGDMSKARIQFKLPIGTPTSATFEATSNLSALRTYVIENIQLPFRKFKMASSFPRKDFTEEDNNKTLLELELVPSAVILILPISNASTTSVAKSTNATGMFSHFLWTLFSPVVSMYNFIIGYFNRRPGDGENQINERERSDNNTNPNIPENFRRNLGATTKIRSRGNVHTLHSRDDDNDENNTWNGNSTQQM